MHAFLKDVRYALRAFRQAGGLTAVALVSLALGIGANTAIFSVASALLLRPLPYQDPERLVILWNRSPGIGIEEDWFSTAQYFDIVNGSSSFEQVAIAIGSNLNLTGDGEPERIGTVRVSPNLLPLLGARPAGRSHLHVRGCGGRSGGHGDPALRHVDAPLRLGSTGHRPDDDAERTAVPDRWRPAAQLHIASRGDAYTRACRGGGGAAAAATRPEGIAGA